MLSTRHFVYILSTKNMKHHFFNTFTFHTRFQLYDRKKNVPIPILCNYNRSDTKLPHLECFFSIFWKKTCLIFISLTSLRLNSNFRHRRNDMYIICHMSRSCHLRKTNEENLHFYTAYFINLKFKHCALTNNFCLQDGPVINLRYCLISISVCFNSYLGLLQKYRNLISVKFKTRN